MNDKLRKRDPGGRAAFENGVLYTSSNISRSGRDAGDDFVDRLLRVKLQTVETNLRGGVLVDLCCATGLHLARFAAQPQRIGIDFSMPFLAAARTNAATQCVGSITFIAADARALPLQGGSVTTLYSLSSLYVVPDIHHVIAEIARVLHDGGRCILDLGNAQSINAYCVRNYYKELPQSHYLRVKDMRALLSANGLHVIEHRAFQLLPLWAGRPKWLWPLLHPAWKRVMAYTIRGRMLDEWLSSNWLFRRFAFRHLMVCEKRRMND